MDLRHSAVPALVDYQASLRPDALAIVDSGLSITYGELEARSNALSLYLRSLGLGQDAVVGLCLGRSAAQIIGALAIMKAGAAYLPLDPSQPSARLRIALLEANARVTLTVGNAEPQGAFAGLHCIELQGNGSFAGELQAFGDAAAGDPAELAYVIYTSGSTGRPKGVEITHAALSNLSSWHRNAFSVDHTDRASYLSAVGFDAAVWEVWPYLTAGASIYIADEATARGAEELADWFKQNAITIAFVATPIAERLLDLAYADSTAMRVLLTGADVLRRYPPASLPFAVYNNYGPTEAAVVATSGRIAPAANGDEGLPSIGQPIDNTEIYILDSDGNKQEDGFEGEICIAGVGLARGYRGQPELTAERFVSIAFDGAPAIRLYRTGDRGRRGRNGMITFLGRIDDQLKLRGFRIEPRDVEMAADAHADVLESAVVVRRFDDADEQLVAFLVPKRGKLLSLTSMQDFLTSRLPAYMVPSRFVELPDLPITANGKIDRVKLRTLELHSFLSTDAYVAFRTLTEERIASIVCSLLKLERVSVKDDFFRLGGHSLLGTQLIARLRDAFGVSIKLRSLFEEPTIAALALEVERQTNLSAVKEHKLGSLT